jgi:hypothetical protein
MRYDAKLGYNPYYSMCGIVCGTQFRMTTEYPPRPPADLGIY